MRHCARIRARIAAAALLMLAPGLAQAGAKIEIAENRYITLGAGVRTSFTAAEDGDDGDDTFSRDFDLESFRLYTGGQLMKYVSLEFNTEFTNDELDEEIRVLDGVFKFEFDDKVNFWFGRFLPPSDRANLSGPYYLNSFDFPFVQQYPAIFAGRDEGASYWGQLGEGMFKWQLGAFEGSRNSNTNEEDLLYSGRLTLNLWEPEGGYYNSSTYYGEKDVLAIGLVGMRQNDGASVVNTSIDPAALAALGNQPLTFNTLNTLQNSLVSNVQDGDFTGWNVDFLMEKKLGIGVLTLEGAYYDYDLDDLGSASNEGDGYFALVSWLLPGEIGVEGFKGRLQPIIRYQEFDPENGAFDEHKRIDFGLNYILDGHNARLSLTVSKDKDAPSSGSQLTLDGRTIVKFGIQFQL